MTDFTSVSSTTPRYFWRRSLAFLIDCVLLGIVSSVIVYAIFSATGVNLGMPRFASTTTCVAAPADHPQSVRMERLWPLEEGEVRVNALCATTILSVPQPDIFVSTVSRKDDSTTYSRTASFAVDEQGQPTVMPAGPEFGLPLFVVLIMLLSANGRRTVGKGIMSLRAIKDDGGEIGWGDSFRREGLKFWPSLVLFLLQCVFWFFSPDLFTGSDSDIIAVRDGLLTTFIFVGSIGAAAGLVPLIWWFGPFFAWRGRTWYDMIVGMRVIKTK